MSWLVVCVPLPISEKLTFLPRKILQRVDLGAHEYVHLLIVETRDIAHAVFDVPADFAGLVEITQDVGLGDAHIDTAQVKDVLQILRAALADDRQDPQIVAVIEDRGNIIGDDR